MVSRNTKHQILDVLHSIAEGEIKSEILRQVLAEKYNFEPYTAFKRLVLAPSSYLTSTDLKDFLADNKVFITSSEAYDLLRSLDLDRDGSLSYSEFLNAVLPKTDSSLRQRATLREAYPLAEDERLPYDVEYGLVRIFEEELKSLQRTESLKRLLNLSYDYTSGRAFNSLDYDAKNYLIAEDLADFSDDLGRGLDDKQIDAILRRLDVDLDGRISYSEFLDCFSYPKTDVSSPRSPRRMNSASPRRTRSPVKSIGSPVRSEIKDIEYRDYLNESRRRSASPRRSHVEEAYMTPTKSPKKIDDDVVYSSKKKSPLRMYEEEELVKAFKDMINSCRLLESTKNDLALRYDFNLYDAYRYFDIHGTGAYISSKQFEEGCADLKIFPTRDQVSLFFKRFDTDYDGLLRFSDFSKLMTPKSLEYAKMIDRRPQYIDPIFTRETERLMAKVIELALDNEVQAESIRQRLTRRMYSLLDAFTAVDKYDQGFIVLEDFKEILEDNGIYASSKDVDMLMERFKKSDNHNGKVSYSEFVREMSPKSNRIY